MELTGLNDYIMYKYKDDMSVDETSFISVNTGKVTDSKGNEIVKGVFKVDLESSLGATQANITGLAPNVTRVYGSNAPAEVNVGTEQPQVALAANDIPHEVLDSIVGLTKATNGGYVRQGSAKVSKGGLIIHSHNDNKDIDFYMAFPYGNFIPGEMSLGTNNENPAQAHDALTFNALARPSDQLLYEKFYSTQEGFDYENMIKFVAGIATTDSIANNTQSGSATHTDGQPNA